MKPQEVITIYTTVPNQDSNKQNIVSTHPELDQFFDKGMYIETVVQSLEKGICALTFVFRYYNASQSKG